MSVIIRAATLDDAETCGPICYEAFRNIAEHHNFPPDLPSPEIGTAIVSMFIAREDVYSVVAEVDGRVVGSNFLSETCSIAGIGPITVDPSAQNSGAGRLLMKAVLDRVDEKGYPGVRLVQAAYHNRSLSLYTRLGFDAREPLSAINGPLPGLEIEGHPVRKALQDDVESCNAVCRRVHGHDRAGEVVDAVAQGSALVVEHDGRVSGYSTILGFFGHVVAETNTDLKALIGAATGITGPGFLLPTRNAEMMRWCLEKGLRVIQPMTLMSKGLYNEPSGAFIPSVLF